MATRTTELAMRVVADVESGVAGLGKIETASTTAAAAVDKVGTAADGVGTKLDGVSASAGNLDDKAGRATGALGALSSGFELVGAEKYAGALQGAALATDFASGAAQAFTLVTELESVAKAKAAIASGVQATATAASTAATKAAAAGQWLLNAALSANPVGLMVAALVLLVAGLVLAYQKSDTFRAIVDTAFGKAKDAVQAVVDVVGNIVDGVQKVIEWVRDKMPGAVENAKTKVVDGFAAMLSPITDIYDKVVALIEKIKDIKVPSVDLNPFSRAATVPSYAAGGSGWTANGMSAGDDAGQVVALLAAILAALKGENQTVSDPVLAARMIRGLLARADRITG